VKKGTQEVFHLNRECKKGTKNKKEGNPKNQLRKNLLKRDCHSKKNSK